MTNKQLSILAIVAVVMVGWAVVQSQIANRSADGDATPSYLIGSLNVDEIASIPMRGSVDSLNLAAAVSIVVFAVSSRDR